MTNLPPIVPGPQPVLLDRFRDILRRDGAAAARTIATSLRVDPTRRSELFYVPFEHMNLGAKVVIVGITPGPNQIALAYDSVRAGLKAGLADADLLARAKEAGSFGGPQMRPNLLKMLRAFDFLAMLGIADAEDLWGGASALLHATSVVPHAAFLGGKPFSGSFDDVLASPVMRECFERDFAATLPLLSPDVLYIALGPTPLGALDWCAARGLLQRERVMGAFAHPSSTGGSQVPVYVGEKAPEDLGPRDPVRHRVPWLLSAAARMRQSVAALAAANRLRLGASQPPLTPAHADTLPLPLRAKAPAARGANRVSEVVSGLHAVVARGADTGMVLRPHVQDGAHIVSTSRFETDYVRVPLDQPLEPWLARGYKLRMSAPGRPPSLIRPASIRGRA